MKIWTNAELPESSFKILKEGLAGHELVISTQQVSNLTAPGHSENLPGCDIAFGQPDPSQVISETSIRWAHITSAGYTRYDTKDFFDAIQSRQGAFTNSSSVYDEPCAQHLLAFMLAHSRELLEAFSAQGKMEWRQGLIRRQSTLLKGSKAVILGYGAIAKRLAEFLTPFQMELKGFRRNVRGNETIPTFAMDDLPLHIGDADHVINILPSNPHSDGMFTSDLFAELKHGSVFYNIGRGTTVDQSALLSALETGQLSAAYLDVTTPEPLPSDHPLWKVPNCYITPHTAGGFADEHEALVKHFLANLQRFIASERLLDRVI